MGLEPLSSLTFGLMVVAEQQASVQRIFSEYLERHGHRKTPERFAILSEVYATRATLILSGSMAA